MGQVDDVAGSGVKGPNSSLGVYWDKKLCVKTDE